MHRSDSSTGLPEIFLSAEIRRKLTRLGLEVLSEKFKTGKLPGDLRQFGEEAIDPFSGKPFRYRITTHGFRVYSLWPAMKDLGGEKFGNYCFEYAPASP